jgi:hypothetical protein
VRFHERNYNLVVQMKETLFISSGKTAALVLSRKALRKPGLGCLLSVLKNFFLLQYRAALFPGRIPVSRADHPLDSLIPFNPRWVAIYLDFVAYWLRITGFFIVRGKKGIAASFIESIGRLYTFAAGVYRKNLSTTDRPRYLKHPRFLLIHLVDPHLMCIPSLHVMIVIRGYTVFRQAAASMPHDPQFTAADKKLRERALDITRAILYVKQHSVNCVSAAMYAMSRFDPALFPPEEAEAFAAGLFAPGGDSPGGPGVLPEDISAIHAHIIGLYRSFFEAGKTAGDWTVPLLDFLKSLPRS